MAQQQVNIPPFEEETFHNKAFQDLASSISSRLSQLYRNLSQLCLDHFPKNPIDKKFASQLQKCFNKLTYPKKTSEGPICGKKCVIGKNQFGYKCYDCLNQNQSNCGYLCSTCFIDGKHMHHRYRVISNSYPITCDCGNYQLISDQNSCPSHGSNKAKFKQQNKIDQKSSIFQQETQFLIYLFLKITKIQANLIDLGKKKSIVGNAILKLMTKFIKNSYFNKLIASNLLTSQFPSYPTLPMNQNINIANKTILRYIIEDRNNVFSQKDLNNLLFSLFSVQKIRQELIIQYFYLTSSTENCHLATTVLSNVSCKLLLNGKMIQRLLSNNKLKPFIINYKFQNSKDKFISYKQLFCDYTIILQLPNNATILEYILSNTNICQLSNFGLAQPSIIQQKTLNYLESFYLDILIRILYKLRKSINYKNILKMIIRETSQNLIDNPKYSNNSINRTFALAIFAFIDGDIQNLSEILDNRLFDCDKMFQQNIIQQMIHRIISTLKIQDQADKFRKPQNINNQINSKIMRMVSIDRIYFKILYNIYVKYDSSMNQQPLMNFLLVKQKSVNALTTIYLNDSIIQMEYPISGYISSISRVIRNMISMVETNIDQIIVASYLQLANKIDVFHVFEFIDYVSKQVDHQQFKNTALVFIENKSLIQQYISQFRNQNKRQFAQGKVPDNMFYFIFYYTFSKQLSPSKDDQLLYQLKLCNRRRSECSKMIFTEAIIEKIIYMFSTFYDFFLKYFRHSKSKSMVLSFREMLRILLMLYLETKQNSLKDFVQKIIIRLKLYNILQQGIACFIQLYQKGEVYLQEKKKLNKDYNLNEEIQKLKKEKANKKKNEKMKQIQRKQTQFLQKLPESKTIIVNQIGQNNSKQCIICKNQSEEHRLYYLCKVRNTYTLAKAFLNVDYPLLLITTCGHIVHKTCLTSNNLRCMLCKNMSTILVPITKKDEILSEQEISNLLIQINNEMILNKVQESFQELPIKIYKSLCYQLFLYSFNFPKYFISKIMPLTYELIKVLRSMNASFKQNMEKMFHQYEDFLKKSSKQSQIFNIIHTIMKSLVVTLKQENKQQLKLIDQQRYLHKQFKEKFFEQFQYIILIFKKCIHKNQEKDLEQLLTANITLDYGCSTMFQFSKDLVDLYRYNDKCDQCGHYTSHILKCFLCYYKFCKSCRFNEKTENHYQSHKNGTVLIEIETGAAVYIREKKMFVKATLYRNNIEQSFSISNKSFPKKGQFLLNTIKREKFLQHILEDEMDIIGPYNGLL